MTERDVAGRGELNDDARAPSNLPADVTVGPVVPDNADRRTADRPVSVADHARTPQEILFGRFLAFCVAATLVLFWAGFATAPASERPALLPLAALVSVIVGLGAWFVRRGFSRQLFVVTAVALMVLGIAMGASLPDGLDAAVILPLAGALLVLPVLRGRPLMNMFVLAFAASLVGGTVAHVVGPVADLTGTVSLPISIASSAVMLGFTYGLVWRVSNDWLASSERAEHALAGQRQLLVLNERMVATLDPERVLNLIADSLKTVVSYDNLTIYRIDRDQGVLRPVLARDRFAPLILETTFALDRGITGWVVAHAEAQCVNDAQNDPRMALIPGTPAEAESLIVVPLAGDGDVVGTLNLGRMGGKESYFDADDFEIAQLFARQASIALLNAETHRAVFVRAETDALTGLFNRRAFEEHLAALLADQTAQPLSLLMLDLDGFKQYNDRHGHPAGDSLLQEVAHSIGAAVRGGDRVYRHGGDEFAVLLPATTEAIGAAVADRIRAAIGNLDAGTANAITASIGAASHPDDSTTRDGLVAAADERLYRAKASGGDRVVSSDIGGPAVPMPAAGGSASREVPSAARR
jgi:diguanylate cyclase (GGDEF)-like protein